MICAVVACWHSTNCGQISRQNWRPAWTVW